MLPLNWCVLLLVRPPGLIFIPKVGEYIASLLARAREISNATYLRATAAAFREAFRMVDAILQASTERDDSNVSNTKAEDVVSVIIHSAKMIMTLSDIECSKSIWMNT